MEKTIKAFDTVAYIRGVRDSHYEQLKGANPEERARFYWAKARALHEELGLPFPFELDSIPETPQRESR